MSTIVASLVELGLYNILRQEVGCISALSTQLLYLLRGFDSRCSLHFPIVRARKRWWHAWPLAWL